MRKLFNIIAVVSLMTFAYAESCALMSELVTTITTTTPYVAPLLTSPSTFSTISSTNAEVLIHTPPVISATTQARTPEPSFSVFSATSTSSFKDGLSGGVCGTVGGRCSGDITYYEAGLGACGWTNNGTTEDVFALAHGMMGEQSNGNPFCGRTANIKVPSNPSQIVSAKLVDKCMGCEGQSIDLSNHLFNQLADRAPGRLHNVEWSFTS